MEKVIEAEELRKDYGTKTVLRIDHISVEPGEILVCLGPSGAGKSVLLRLLNLLEKPTAGKISFKSKQVHGLRGRSRVEVARSMAMLFQDPLLFKTSVYDNVAYGLKIRKVPRHEIEERVGSVIGMVNMRGFEEKHVSTLSGGEAQRVALARALVVGPELIFLDEPFANLDRLNRAALQSEVKRILKESGISAVFVTHDQEEAALMGDRILILSEGRIVQEGTALDIFFRPESEFIARFVGMENIFSGTVVSTAGGLSEIRVEDKAIEVITEKSVGETVKVGLRPEDVTLVPVEELGSRASSRNAFRGRVSDVETAGATARVTVECPFPVVSIITRRSLEDLGIAAGDGIGVRFKATAVHVI